MADESQLVKAEVLQPLRDQRDRLNVQLPNFTLNWKDPEYYYTANGTSKQHPGDAFNNVQWALDPLGFVHIKGLCNTVDTFVAGRLFNLPREARPSRQVYTRAIGQVNPGGNFVAVLITIYPDGRVDANGGGSQLYWVALDGISFWKEGP